MKLLKGVLKILLTIVAVVFVLNRINPYETWQIIRNCAPVWLITSCILYLLSQIISAWRLNLFFLAEKIQVSTFENIKLYFRGMFYNLFLLGGIGGDGYKMFYLYQNKHTSLKKIFRALAADRVNGALAVFILGMVLFLMTVASVPVLLKLALTVFVLLIIPLSWLIVYLFFNSLRKKWLQGLACSFAVQATQLMAAIVIFVGLEIPSTSFLQYAGVFLLSSLASALPITVGGVGTRELTFLWASRLVPIRVEKAIAFAVLFFLINAVCSLPGIFIKVGNGPLPRASKACFTGR